MIDLILWRHADAHEGWPDMKRQLTPLGLAQARATADWLKPRLPERYWLMSSPADRARQTAEALGHEIRFDDRLIPGGDTKDYADAIEWPDGPQGCPGTLVLVGHQPNLGAIAARLLTGMEYGFEVQKSSIWWFTSRAPGALGQTVFKAMLTPTMLGVETD